MLWWTSDMILQLISLVNKANVLLRKQKRREISLNLLRSACVRLSWKERCFHWIACLFGWCVKRRFSEILWRKGVSRSNGLRLNHLIHIKLWKRKKSYPPLSTSSGVSKNIENIFNKTERKLTLFIFRYRSGTRWTNIRIR
jgi:hypothetical protein